MRTCSVEGCDRPYLARDYCGIHYRRYRQYGDPLGGSHYKKPTPVRTCDVDGCSRRHSGLGLCATHLARQKRHGSPTGGRASTVLGIERQSIACSTDDCEAGAQAGGQCWSHYNRSRYDPATAARYSAEYRARERGATVERFTALEIYERDSWRCGLCSKRISQQAKYPNPMSPSIDHIVPLIEDGEHSRRNVQASHLVCNKRKGVRGQAQQLSLIG